jgi:5-methylcytosine-specific restriction endonuclease McrA
MSEKQKHKEWRKSFNEKVFKRDNNKCRVCGKAGVDAHHIIDRHEMPNGGYVPTNGICLCAGCHIDAEQFHIHKGSYYVGGFHPDDLYALIKSSYELAMDDSKNL